MNRFEINPLIRSIFDFIYEVKIKSKVICIVPGSVINYFEVIYYYRKKLL